MLLLCMVVRLERRLVSVPLMSTTSGESLSWGGVPTNVLVLRRGDLLRTGVCARRGAVCSPSTSRIMDVRWMPRWDWSLVGN